MPKKNGTYWRLVCPFTVADTGPAKKPSLEARTGAVTEHCVELLHVTPVPGNVPELDGGSSRLRSC